MGWPRLLGEQGARVMRVAIGYWAGMERKSFHGFMDREGSVLAPLPTPDTSGAESGWPRLPGEQGARVIRVVNGRGGNGSDFRDPGSRDPGGSVLTPWRSLGWIEPLANRGEPAWGLSADPSSMRRGIGWWERGQLMGEASRMPWALANGSSPSPRGKQ
jgi:hypothetical protein